MLKRKVLIILLALGLVWQFSPINRGMAFSGVEKVYAAEKEDAGISQDSATNEEGLVGSDGGSEAGEDSGVINEEPALPELQPSLPIIEEVQIDPQSSQPQVLEKPKNSVNSQPQNQPLTAPASYQANAGDVVINELMWMGSTQSSSDEWLELRNVTGSDIDFSANTWSIYKNDTLMMVIDSGTLGASGYFLISNYNDDSANSLLGIAPDLVDSAVSLSNSAVQYKLYDADDNSGELIDTADRGTGAPLAGINVTDKKYSMERNLTPGDGTLAVNWHTANKSMNFDVISVNENGTPKAVNSQTPNFISVVSNKIIYKNGDTVVITATLNQNNYQISADFSQLDDQFNPGDETFIDNNDNTYTITYTVSNNNGLADSAGIGIQVEADDEINPVIADNSLFVKLDNTNPDMPQNLKVVTGEGFVYLNWDLVLDAEHYEIWRSDRLFPVTTIGIDYRDNNVIGGKTYTYKVIAVDEAGNKSDAALISATPPVIIIAPDVTPTPAVKSAVSVSVESTEAPQIASAVVEKEAIKEVEQVPQQEEGNVQGEETEEEQAPTNWPLIIGIALAGLVVIFWVYYWYISWKESKPKSRRKK